MAACDNLYGNREEWQELRDFLSKNNSDALVFMKSQPKEGEEIRICYIADIQDYLIENCPLDWVKERLSENFCVQRMILGRAHHERDI